MRESHACHDVGQGVDHARSGHHFRPPAEGNRHAPALRKRSGASARTRSAKPSPRSSSLDTLARNAATHSPAAQATSRSSGVHGRPLACAYATRKRCVTSMLAPGAHPSNSNSVDATCRRLHAINGERGPGLDGSAIPADDVALCRSAIGPLMISTSADPTRPWYVSRPGCAGANTTRQRGELNLPLGSNSR
jgi:hypothetical protein